MLFNFMKFLIVFTFIFALNTSYAADIPSLKGTWIGKNNTFQIKEALELGKRRLKL